MLSFCQSKPLSGRPYRRLHVRIWPIGVEFLKSDMKDLISWVCREVLPNTSIPGVQPRLALNTDSQNGWHSRLSSNVPDWGHMKSCKVLSSVDSLIGIGVIRGRRASGGLIDTHERTVVSPETLSIYWVTIRNTRSYHICCRRVPLPL